MHGDGLHVYSQEHAEVDLQCLTAIVLEYLAFLSPLVPRVPESAAVPSELVLEADQVDSFLFLVAVRADLVFGSLACLVPPPLVDLLLAHTEVRGVLGPHLLDALSGPHDVLG